MFFSKIFSVIAHGSQPDRVKIFDTTLRDGEQAATKALNIEQKVEIAQMLDRMGVDIIEAGFPASSDEDFAGVQSVARAVKNATVAALCRANDRDIDRAAEAIREAAHPRIHTFISTSPIHIRAKLKMTEDEVVAKISESVARAKSHVDDVEWSAEDAGRTPFKFLRKCVQAAIDAGATTINLPDTVGYMTPEEYERMFRRIRFWTRNNENVTFSAHCHDDLGNATNNSLAAVRGGARQIECTINGVGERAGNTSMEEVVMNMKVRSDKFPYKTGIASEYFTAISHHVAEALGMVVAPNKAIVGAHAFAHRSGIHQDGVIKDAETYEIMTPESVGSGSSIVLFRHSGRNALFTRLAHIGVDIPPEEQGAAFKIFKAHADRTGSEITDNELLTMFGEVTTMEDMPIIQEPVSQAGHVNGAGFGAPAAV
ncbi:MAG: 2-isopropylmalate synthase [Pseudobdellovibrionaceae bacterium]